MEMDLEKLVFDWVKSNPERVDVKSEHYCQTRDVFQARLDKMVKNLLQSGNISEGNVYIISAMAGEIGNNSFDHNLGNWPDVVGIFFGYEITDGKLKIILADRGRGIQATLKKVKPEIENDKDALRVAFTERISGRFPERRGNGLKFVRENVEEKKMHLTFISGNAKIELNAEMKIEEAEENVRGCLAILTM